MPKYVGDSTIWDEDKYTLAVHYPTYLYWDGGNLSVSSPLVEDDRIPIQDGKTSYSSRGGLIIWIEHFTGNIKEMINVLFEKAEDAWNLAMPWKE